MGRKKGTLNKPKNLTDNLTFGNRAQSINEKAKEISEAIVNSNPGITKNEDGIIITDKEYTPPENVLPDETVLVHGVDFTHVVREVLYLGSLGAELTPKKLPRLVSSPYAVSLTLSGENYLKYKAREDEVFYSSTLDYNRVTITSMDPIVYIKQLLELGKKQAVIPENKVVKSGKPYQAVVYTKVPVVNSANITMIPREPLKYSKEQLESMKMNELKLIGKEYSVTGRSKDSVIEGILKAQTGE